MNPTKTLFKLVCIFVCSNLFAQQSRYGDSLKAYNKMGQYAKALPFAILQYAATSELEENDTVRVSAVYELGFDYYQLGFYDSAAFYFAKTCDSYKNVYGEVSFKYTGSLNDLASAYKNMGKYDTAEALYIKTINLKKEFNGEDSGYAISLNQLGLLYYTLGKYSNAEELFLKECFIFKKTGEKTAAYAMAAGNLALVYSGVGNYARAEKLQKQVLAIRKEILGEKHPMFALALSNLSTVYANMGDYHKADSLQALSLKLTQQTLQSAHPQYLKGLLKLGNISFSLKNYPAAESFYMRAIDSWKKIYGEDEVEYLLMFDALSELYIKTGRRKIAENRFLQSLAHYDTLQMRQHPYRLDLLYRIVNLYLSGNAPKTAKSYLATAMQEEHRALLTKLDYLSETELLFYLQSRDQALALGAPYRFLLQNQSADILKTAYDNCLLFKGIAIQNMKSLNTQLVPSKDSSFAGLRKKYQQNKLILNKLLLIPVAKRTADTDSLGDITNQQEKDLLRMSADYRQLKSELNISWEQVRDNLQASEAAVEFVRFNDYTPVDSRIYYAAMLIRQGDQAPSFVKLFEEKQLIASLKTFAYKSSLRGSAIYPLSHDKSSLTNAVYGLVWQPLEPYLSGIKKVYFSPDGLLHQLAFAALPCNKRNLLCDKYDLIQLGSTRQIAIKKSNATPNNAVALFGGINYNKQETGLSQQVGANLYAYAYRQNRGVEVDSFRFLPNTLKEVNAIQKDVWPAHKTSVLFTGENATEQAFQQLGGIASPQIIHFATHGFTLPHSNSGRLNPNSFQQSDNPLLRCGLVMAGGNKGWQGKSVGDEDDGILTGLEISSVPLPNTELVVLSACETGLGQVMGNEGVFGLQRAFKLAGVNYVMASLWPVPDKETAEFMGRFYKNWVAGKSIRQAFLATQRAFRAKYPPYFWAGFTLVQ